jgi:pullulanase
MRQRRHDCFNWGYDPFHFNAPEGSYASDAADGAVRIVEFRAWCRPARGRPARGHGRGLQPHQRHPARTRSVLDRIVPGYYHRLNANGGSRRSTCCDNTATENLMMGKLMIDSVRAVGARVPHRSFRFDLMGHQPRAVMEELQARRERRRRPRRPAGRRGLELRRGGQRRALRAGLAGR